MEPLFSYTQNRELSWLRFNARILEEAENPAIPLLERLRYTEIFSRNLDEFFMVRVGRLILRSKTTPHEIDKKSGMTPQEQLHAIYSFVSLLYEQLDRCQKIILDQLSEHNIVVTTFTELLPREQRDCRQFFLHKLSPILSPQIIDSHHPFPNLQSKILHMAVRLKYNRKSVFGIIPFAPLLPSYIFLPGTQMRILPTSDILFHMTDQIFPGYTCMEHVLIRLIKSNDINPNTEELSEIDFRQSMQRLLKQKHACIPVRLEVSGSISTSFRSFLQEKFGVQPSQIFCSKKLEFRDLTECLLPKLTNTQKNILLFPAFTPHSPILKSRNSPLIKLLNQQDLLLSYPYESMKPFLQLLQESAQDPAVISIKITLYRLSKHAKLIEYLCSAAENGKQVTVLIELRARFDEENNIDWSERLEDAGCTILYGLPLHKVHSKICLITRHDRSSIRYITHIGTGNFNEKTATQYTDLSYITADQEIGQDAAELFRQMMTGTLRNSYQELLVAPLSLKQAILALIDHQIARGQHGRIVLKVNAITDLEIIQKLRDACKANVSVTLIVRGICCILPDIPGETEELQIRSIVGRFLEHSRIYCFGSGDQEIIYLSSADLMTRNTQCRIEVACPIRDPRSRQKIRQIIDCYLQDNTTARVMQSDGTYTAVVDTESPFDCQDTLLHNIEDEPFSHFKAIFQNWCKHK